MNELPRGKPRGIKSLTSVDARQAAGVFDPKQKIKLMSDEWKVKQGKKVCK
jgi:hypothetical protein